MKLTDEQLKKLLKEQAETEEALTEKDIEAYTLLFETLKEEKDITSPSITDEVMARVLFLEERKDRRKDTLNLLGGIAFGIITIMSFYFFIDLPLLKTYLLWVKDYLPIIAFALLAIGLIQIADRKLLRKS